MCSGLLRRTQQLLQHASIANQKAFSNLYSPAGLNIGASGPVEIALAIVAQIQAVMNSGSTASIADGTIGKVLSNG